MGRPLRRRRSSRDDGVVLVITALALGVIFGMAAFAIDLGNVGQTAQGAQDAVDAAAVSGAQLLGQSSGSLGEIVTKIEDFVQANYPAISADTANLGGVRSAWDHCASPPSSFVTPDDSYGNAQDCISFDSANPPGSTDPARVVNVALPPQSVASTFGKALGYGGPSDLTASATAAFAPTSSPCALCVLGASGTTLATIGHATLTVTSTSPGAAAIAVGSSGVPAISASGASSISAPGGTISVVGTSSGNVSPTPVAAGTGSSDPLVYLGTPTSSPDQGSYRADGHTSFSIGPGVYQDITVTGGATLTLQPGTYVITGTFSVGGTSSVSGAGVTLYFTCGDSSAPQPCTPGEQGGKLTLAGGSIYELTAATSGPFANVLVYYDRNDASPLTMVGNSGIPAVGTIYARSASLSLSGTPTSLDSLVDVGALSLAGNTEVTITYDPLQNAGPMAANLCTLEPASLANC